VQDCAVIRLTEGRLAWYPPGAGGAPRSLDDEALREQLKLTASQPGSTVCFAAPGADVRLCQLDILPAEKKHIAKSLPFMLEEGLAEDIEDLHFARGMQGKSVVTAAICRREKMREWQTLLADFGGINRWIPEPLLLPWQEGEWCLVIERDKVMVRTGSFAGFSVEPGLLGPVLATTLAQSADSPRAVVVYGQQQEHDTELIPHELRDRVQWRRGDLGSALLLSSSLPASFNLLQGDFAVRLPLARWWKQWRAVAATIVIALAVQLAATYAELVNLQRENSEMLGAVEVSYRRAYPEGAMVDAEKQLKRQLGSLRGPAQSSGFISLMNRVGAIIAGKPGTGIVSINYNDRGNEIRMNITAADFETVEAIRTAMNAAGLNAVMESSSAQGDLVRARMRIGDGS